MKLPISARLLACCNYVNQNDRIADVGCDHGYLSIHLLRKGIARSAIASDVNEQPLLAAVRNAQKYGVKDKMEFFLSDGVQNIPRDFDCLVCAGMGADTMISIFSAAPWLKDPKYRLILQCQSRRPELRRWLSDQGYAIRQEDLVRDGKFIYTVMEVSYIPGTALTPSQCYISPALEKSGSPLLGEYRQRVLQGLRLTSEGLSRAEDPRQAEYRGIIRALETPAQDP